MQAANVLDKLNRLDSSQDSICSTSEYCRFYDKVGRAGSGAGSPSGASSPAESPGRAQEAHKLVGLWETAFDRSRDSAKRLALLYLANDILQNSRKKGTHFVQPYYRVLPRAVRATIKQGDAGVLPAALGAVRQPGAHGRACGAAGRCRGPSSGLSASGRSAGCLAA